MIENIEATAKQIGDALIDLSAVLDQKMEKWSDVSSRPHNLSETQCVGFINKETATAGLNLVVDIQAPENKNEAVLRIWAIESKLGEDQIERFNNIQLDFSLDYEEAVLLTKKANAVTRSDIRAILHNQNTKVTRIIISKQAGFDKASQQSLGERYDMTISELSQDASLGEKALNTAHTVLDALKESAAVESKL